jgi:hypothetical protein
VFCARKYFDLFPPIARHVTLQVLDFHELLLLLPLELHVDRSLVLIIIIVFDVVSIGKYYDDYCNTFNLLVLYILPATSCGDHLELEIVEESKIYSSMKIDVHASLVNVFV